MKINAEHFPFAAYGSLLAVTKEQNKNELRIHDVLRPVGGSTAVRVMLVPEDIKLKNINHDDTDIPSEDFTVDTEPSRMIISSSKGTAEICFTADDTINVRSHGLTFGLFIVTIYGYGMANDNVYTVFMNDVKRIMRIEAIKGKLTAEGTDNHEYGERQEMCLNLKIVPENDESEFEIQAAFTDGKTADRISHEEAIIRNNADWESFVSAMPAVNENYRDFAEIAWYNLWSSFVRKNKNYPADTVVMSKKTMTAVWSWDHCFNALALAYTDRNMAFEQYFAPFYHQTKVGCLPDMWKAEGEILWSITKPPIHGWAFGKLMDIFDFDTETLEKVYRGLALQTDWWMNYRDENHNGIPAYPQGNDSGWDNSTVFDADYFIESPDLPSYLILEMKTLARLAEKLGKRQEAENWNIRADKLIADMISVLWDGERFISRKSRDGEPTGNESSLINKMAVVIGEYLPEEIAKKTVETIKKENLTAHGLATESPSSKKYETDGYWRGPIWAPTTLLVVDGLARMGEKDLAKEISKRFCDMCKYKAEGFYENFDALNGTGLRAPGYTWTSSVFLILVKEYLSE